MCKRSNAFSRPVLIIRGLDFENTTPLWSFEGRAHPRRRPHKSTRFPVVIARGKHLFPFRTEKLSPSAPMVLGARAPGRVGRRRDKDKSRPSGRLFSFFGGGCPKPHRVAPAHHPRETPTPARRRRGPRARRRRV